MAPHDQSTWHLALECMFHRRSALEEGFWLAQTSSVAGHELKRDSPFGPGLLTMKTFGLQAGLLNVHLQNVLQHVLQCSAWPQAEVSLVGTQLQIELVLASSASRKPSPAPGLSLHT